MLSTYTSSNIAKNQTPEHTRKCTTINTMHRLSIHLPLLQAPISQQPIHRTTTLLANSEVPTTPFTRPPNSLLTPHNQQQKHPKSHRRTQNRMLEELTPDNPPHMPQ